MADIPGAVTTRSPLKTNVPGLQPLIEQSSFYAQNLDRASKRSQAPATPFCPALSLQLKAAVHAALLMNAVQMGFHCRDANAKMRRDFLHAEPARAVGNDFPLSQTERLWHVTPEVIAEERGELKGISLPAMPSKARQPFQGKTMRRKKSKTQETGEVKCGGGQRASKGAEGGKVAAKTANAPGGAGEAAKRRGLEFCVSALRTTTSCKECGEEIPESLLAEALCVHCRYASPAKKAAADAPTEFSIALETYAVESQPAEPAPRGDNPDLEEILGWLASGQADANTIGARVLILAFLFPLAPGRPLNLRELGARLGCSKTAAGHRVARLRAYFVEQRRKNEAEGCQPEPNQ
jgi:hypothetical protein